MSSTSAMKWASISGGTVSMQTMRCPPSRVPGRGRPLDHVVADADDEVGAAHQALRVVLPAQPRGEEEVRVRGVEHALAHERRDHVQAGLLAEGAQGRGRLLTDDAVADQQHRPPGAPDGLGGAQQAHGVGLDHRLGAVRQRPAGHRRLHDVFGQLEVRGPGLLRGGDAERLAHRLRHHPRVVEPGVPLGHRPQHLDGVDELVRGLLVHAGEAGLTGERDQGRVVEGRVADAGGQVAGAGTERGEADAGLAGEPAIGVGHEGRALLVPGRHEDDQLGTVERLAEVERLLAGDAEDELDALVLEAVDEELGGDARLVACRRRRKDGVWPVTHTRASVAPGLGAGRGRVAETLAADVQDVGEEARRAVGRARAACGTRRIRGGSRRCAGRRALRAAGRPSPRRRWRRRRGRGSPASPAPAESRPRGRSCRRCRCTG